MKYLIWFFVVLLLFLATVFAQAHAPYAPERKLQRCMVYLPNVKDAKLRHWCLKQQERMP